MSPHAKRDEVNCLLPSYLNFHLIKMLNWPKIWLF
jgi:hypothetical protein